MARSINLYSRLFNRDENVHYCFSDKQKYFEAIAPYVLMSVPFGNWRINKGQLIVSAGAFDSAGVDWQSVCYVADWPEATSKAEFYYVTRKYEQSGYIVFLIEKDIWATNYPKVKLSELKISRCNRAIGNGIYDDIKEVAGDEQYRTTAVTDTPIHYSFVFLASVVLKENWFGSNSITQTIMFAIPMSDVISKASGTWQGISAIDKVRFIIGGIHSCAGSFADSHAQILRCWVVPRDLINYSDVSIARLSGTSFVAGGNFDFNNVKVAQGFTGFMKFDLSEFIGSANEWKYEYKLAFGPWGHEMTLTRFTEDHEVYLRSQCESAEIRIEMYQGNNVLDVTSNFELDLNINNQVGTAAQQSQKALAKLTAIVGSAAIGYKKFGYAGAVVGALTSISAVTEHPTAKSPSGTNGDALTTFNAQTSDSVLFPWVLKGWKSVGNEAENAYVNGANFNIYNDDLNAIQSLEHLGARAVADDSTFIKAESLCVDGVDLQTSDYIKQEFMRGIRYKCLR